MEDLTFRKKGRSGELVLATNQDYEGLKKIDLVTVKIMMKKW